MDIRVIDFPMHRLCYGTCSRHENSLFYSILLVFCSGSPKLVLIFFMTLKFRFSLCITMTEHY